MRSFDTSLLFVLCLLLCGACSLDPKPIVYGEDQCHACKMMIADPRFGSELVTTKGKIYTYDAIECLVPAYLESGANTFAHVLVSDYENPGNLIDARQAAFLISEMVPSPMGRYLSAYRSVQDLRAQILTKDDRRLSWSELIQEFRQ